MDITFQISERQQEALSKLLPLAAKELQDPNSLAKAVFITFLTQKSQELLAQELQS